MVLVIDLYLGYLLYNFELFKGEIVLELTIENLHLLKVDVHVKRIIHQNLVILLVVDLHQRTS